MAALLEAGEGGAEVVMPTITRIVTKNKAARIAVVTVNTLLRRLQHIGQRGGVVEEEDEQLTVGIEDFAFDLELLLVSKRLEDREVCAT
jgi:hypothetical protein